MYVVVGWWRVLWSGVGLLGSAVCCGVVVGCRLVVYVVEWC